MEISKGNTSNINQPKICQKSTHYLPNKTAQESINMLIWNDLNPPIFIIVNNNKSLLFIINGLFKNYVFNIGLLYL